MLPNAKQKREIIVGNAVFNARQVLTYSKATEGPWIKRGQEAEDRFTVQLLKDIDTDNARCLISFSNKHGVVVSNHFVHPLTRVHVMTEKTSSPGVAMWVQDFVSQKTDGKGRGIPEEVCVRIKFEQEVDVKKFRQLYEQLKSEMAELHCATRLSVWDPMRTSAGEDRVNANILQQPFEDEEEEDDDEELDEEDEVDEDEDDEVDEEEEEEDGENEEYYEEEEEVEASEEGQSQGGNFTAPDTRRQPVATPDKPPMTGWNFGKPLESKEEKRAPTIVFPSQPSGVPNPSATLSWSSKDTKPFGTPNFAEKLTDVKNQEPKGTSSIFAPQPVAVSQMSRDTKSVDTAIIAEKPKEEKKDEGKTSSFFNSQATVSAAAPFSWSKGAKDVNPIEAAKLTQPSFNSTGPLSFSFGVPKDTNAVDVTLGAERPVETKKEDVKAAVSLFNIKPVDTVKTFEVPKEQERNELKANSNIKSFQATAAAPSSSSAAFSLSSLSRRLETTGIADATTSGNVLPQRQTSGEKIFPTEGANQPVFSFTASPLLKPKPFSPPNRESSASAPAFSLNGDVSAVTLSPKTRVTRFYEKHNPTKLEEIPRLLEKYKGKEEELYKKLAQKYNVPLDEDQIARPSSATTALNTSAATVSASPAGTPFSQGTLSFGLSNLNTAASAPASGGGFFGAEGIKFGQPSILGQGSLSNRLGAPSPATSFGNFSQSSFASSPAPAIGGGFAGFSGSASGFSALSQKDGGIFGKPT